MAYEKHKRATRGSKKWTSAKHAQFGTKEILGYTIINIMLPRSNTILQSVQLLFLHQELNIEIKGRDYVV